VKGEWNPTMRVSHGPDLGYTSGVSNPGFTSGVSNPGFTSNSNPGFNSSSGPGGFMTGSNPGYNSSSGPGGFATGFNPGYNSSSGPGGFNTASNPGYNSSSGPGYTGSHSGYGSSSAGFAAGGSNSAYSSRGPATDDNLIKYPVGGERRGVPSQDSKGADAYSNWERKMAQRSQQQPVGVTEQKSRDHRKGFTSTMKEKKERAKDRTGLIRLVMPETLPESGPSGRRLRFFYLPYLGIGPFSDMFHIFHHQNRKVPLVMIMSIRQ